MSGPDYQISEATKVILEIAAHLKELGEAFSKTGNPTVGNRLWNWGGDLGFSAGLITRGHARLTREPSQRDGERESTPPVNTTGEA